MATGTVYSFNHVLSFLDESQYWDWIITVVSFIWWSVETQRLKQNYRLDLSHTGFLTICGIGYTRDIFIQIPTTCEKHDA